MKVTDTIVFDASDVTPPEWSLTRNELSAVCRWRYDNLPEYRTLLVKDWLNDHNVYPKRAATLERIERMEFVPLIGLLHFLGYLREREAEEQ